MDQEGVEMLARARAFIEADRERYGSESVEPTRPWSPTRPFVREGAGRSCTTTGAGCTGCGAAWTVTTAGGGMFKMQGDSKFNRSEFLEALIHIAMMKFLVVAAKLINLKTQILLR